MPVSFPADQFGNIVPILPVKYGSSLDTAVSGTSTAATAFGSGDGCVVRVFAIGCDVYYVWGTSGVAAAAATMALLPAGAWMDVPVASGATHFRAMAKSGSGTFRTELLGA